jgi:hypothetical protein
MEVETELSQLERRRKFSVSDFFDFKGNNTSLRTEILAGITTFLATMYIIIVNPMIISNTGLFEHHSDSSDLFDQPGNQLGIIMLDYFKTVCWKSPRNNPHVNHFRLLCNCCADY